MILEKQFSSIQFLFSYAFLNGNQLLKKELPFLEVDPNFSRCVCVCVCVCVYCFTSTVNSYCHVGTLC